MKEEQLKQKLESVANVLRTALLVERNISTMTRDVLRDTVAEVDTMVADDLTDQDKNDD